MKNLYNLRNSALVGYFYKFDCPFSIFFSHAFQHSINSCQSNKQWMFLILALVRIYFFYLTDNLSDRQCCTFQFFERIFAIKRILGFLKDHLNYQKQKTNNNYSLGMFDSGIFYSIQFQFN